MSQFLCKCGHVISIVKYPSAHESIVLSQASLDHAIARVADVVAQLIAVGSSDREEWLRRQFSAEYPSDASNCEIIDDVVSSECMRRGRRLIECPSCGRIYVEIEPENNKYMGFFPEDEGSGL